MIVPRNSVHITRQASVVVALCRRKEPPARLQKEMISMCQQCSAQAKQLVTLLLSNTEKKYPPKIQPPELLPTELSKWTATGRFLEILAKLHL